MKVVGRVTAGSGGRQGDWNRERPNTGVTGKQSK